MYRESQSGENPGMLNTYIVESSQGTSEVRASHYKIVNDHLMFYERCSDEAVVIFACYSWQALHRPGRMKHTNKEMENKDENIQDD